MKTAMVTGGSRGIGMAIAIRLEKANFKVVCPSRNELDLADLNSVEKFILANPQFKPDVLINNAGENTVQNLADIDLPTWQRIQNINLNSNFLLTQAFGKKMIEKKWGRILNIASLFSFLTREGRASYTSAKTGLLGLTRTAAVEWARHGVMVNALSPGYVDTELTRKNNDPARIMEICKSIPLGRMSTQEELAEVALFLVSDMNTSLTGQNIVVDGGLSIL